MALNRNWADYLAALLRHEADRRARGTLGTPRGQLLVRLIELVRAERLEDATDLYYGQLDRIIEKAGEPNIPPPPPLPPASGPKLRP